MNTCTGDPETFRLMFAESFFRSSRSWDFATLMDILTKNQNDRVFYNAIKSNFLKGKTHLVWLWTKNKLKAKLKVVDLLKSRLDWSREKIISLGRVRKRERSTENTDTDTENILRKRREENEQKQIRVVSKDAQGGWCPTDTFQKLLIKLK
jgi:hypothetical protein